MSSATLDIPPAAASPAEDASAATPMASAAPAPGEGADELISRLAGEEIDRLIATDLAGDDSTAANAAPASPVLDSSVVDTELADKAETLDLTAAAETPTADATLESEVLDAVLKEVTPATDPLDEVSQPPGDLPAASGSITESPNTSSENPGEAAAANPGETPPATVDNAPIEGSPSSEAPSEALSSDAPAAETAIPDAPAEEAATRPPVRPKYQRPDHVGPPFLSAPDKWHPSIDVLATLPDLMPAWQAYLLSPLLLINRPFERLSPGVRNAIGLLAFLTLFNSAVILVWVFFFKHKSM